MAEQQGEALQKVLAGASDGRATFHRFKQEQLAVLFNILSSNEKDILASLKADTGYTSFELQLEYTLVIRHVDKLFKSSDFHALQNQDNENFRHGAIVKPIGTVVIIADAIAPLDSWISPLATAIASGNTALTFLPKCTRMANLLLPLLLALNRSAYQFLSCLVSSDFLSSLPPTVHLFATSYSSSLRAELRSAPVMRTILPAKVGDIPVIVTASSTIPLPLLAAQIVRSMYTLSYVLVHEDLQAELVDELVRQHQKAFGVDPRLSGEVRVVDSEDREMLADLLEKGVSGGLNVLSGGVGETAALPTLVVGAHSSALLRNSTRGPILPVVAISSLEDALAVLSDGLGSSVYAFGNAQDVKYLAGALEVSAFYVNEIPLESLVGASSISFTGAIRYHPSIFQTSSTIVSHSRSPLLPLYPPYTFSAIAALEHFRGSKKKLTVPRTMHTPILRRAFFPQGFFLVAGSVLVSILGTAGIGVWLAVKKWIEWKGQRV